MKHNWSDAYDNLIHIPDVEGIMQRWAKEAAVYREECAKNDLIKMDQPYGKNSAETYDVFLPKAKAKGIVVYVHGGYWKAGDKGSYSHMMKAFTQHEFVAAAINYPLCPQVHIPDIEKCVASAIEHIAMNYDGPIYLIGHSAGGHLITRQICSDDLLSDKTRSRIKRLLAISGLFDLRPIIKTDMNDILHLNMNDSIKHSPALLQPYDNTEIICIVGGEERTELIRQTKLLANIWSGFDLRITDMIESGCHHLNIVETLLNSNHPVLRSFLL